MPHHPEPPLIDVQGRRVSYLRLSITDRCDLRCTYCMADQMTFLPRADVLSFEECLRLVAAFVDLGVTKVRVTGGEPLVRKDAPLLLGEMAKLPGLRELVLTTNGARLEHHADALRKAGVRRVNISLDSLDAQRFRRITRVGDLARVKRGIDAARTAGFESVKLNTVLLPGVNDDELADLVRFAIDRAIDISFIEEMPMGETGRAASPAYLSSDEALAALQSQFTLLPSTETTGGPARYWRIPGVATRVGFISPRSHNFCATCNRVRVTCTGELHACLGHDGAIPLMPLLRGPGAGQDGALHAAIREALAQKPVGHAFDSGGEVMRFMSRTGG